MKSAVIFFHSGSQSIYKKRWIDKCIDSISDQSYQDFDVFEIDYSGDMNMLCEITGHKYKFYNKKLSNHIEAMNFIISKVFKLGYDVIFNTNIDDYYHSQRFERQIKLIAGGYDIVSSNFNYIKEIGDGDLVFKKLDMHKYGSIEKNLSINHNVIAHPCIAISNRFWNAGFRYNENLIGSEDLDLWKRSVGKVRFHIIPDFLLFYRIHENQITKNHKA